MSVAESISRTRSIIPVPLTEEWLPTQLRVRDGLLRKIEEELEDGQNLYITGDTGVGKTVTVRTLVVTRQFHDCLAVHINSVSNQGLEKTTYDELLQQGVTFYRGRTVPTSTQITELPYDRMFMFFDDFDRVMPFNYNIKFLFALYEHALKARVKKRIKSRQIALISKIGFQSFQQSFPKDLFHRFDFKPIIFPTYTPHELSELLTQRVERVWRTFDTGAINFISAKIARYGNMRIGLSILANAWRHNQTQLTMDAIKKGWHDEKLTYWKQVLLGLSSHAGFFLFCLAKIFTSNPSVVEAVRTREYKTDSRTLYGVYENMLRRLGVEPLFYSRRTNELTKLAKAEHVALARIGYGRGRSTGLEIKLQFDEPEIIVEAGSQIDWQECLR